MRVSREQMADHRRTILEAAGRLFREHGLEAVTVAQIMQAAGLTHGGFYGHFASKEDLVARALESVLVGRPPAPNDLAAYAAEYLSPAHRDNRAGGCPTAALATETSRLTGEARNAMTASLKRQIEHLSRITPGDTDPEKRQAAIGSWAAMVGAVILARVSDDPDLSDEVLSQTLAWLTHGQAERNTPPFESDAPAPESRPLTPDPPAPARKSPPPARPRSS